MRKIPFYKYHGLGNDFIVIDLLANRMVFSDLGKLALAICSRNSGIGADGIIVLSKSRDADCRMEIYNSDGSWAEKSGNGLRIAAAHFYAYHKPRKQIIIETATDISDAEIKRAGEKGFLMRVSLGRPQFESQLVPIKSKFKYHINCPTKINGKIIKLTALSVGNPHAVLFVNDFSFDWRVLGRNIETAPIFRNRTNVEFVKIVNRRKVVLNDWERGAGATGSSGTGAAAAVVAGVINGLLERKVEVVFPSGSLYIEWSDNKDSIHLTGPVQFIGHGIFLSNLK